MSNARAGSPGNAAASPSTTVSRPASPLRSALARVAATAAGSTSIPTADAAPRRSAAIASTPLPQPTSSTASPPRTRSDSAVSASRVELCAPLPKARPGSITTSTAPATPEEGSAATHGGRTTRRPARTGRAWSRQASRAAPRSTATRSAGQRPATAASRGSTSPPGGGPATSTTGDPTPTGGRSSTAAAPARNSASATSSTSAAGTDTRTVQASPRDAGVTRDGPA